MNVEIFTEVFSWLHCLTASPFYSPHYNSLAVTATFTGVEESVFPSSKNIVVPKIHVLLEQHAYLSAAFPSMCDRKHLSWILCIAFL